MLESITFKYLKITKILIERKNNNNPDQWPIR